MIDAVQFLSFSISLFGIFAWAIKLRRWPLIYAALSALIANVLFFVARTLNLMIPLDLNLFSAIRNMLMAIVIAAIPFAVHK